MTETLAGSALMKEASKCSETLQEYRSGYENLLWEKFKDSDLKQISLDLSFTESQDVPYGSKTSQSADKCRMMITLQKIPQIDGPAPANKTQLSEWPQALRISWIEPPLDNGAPLLETKNYDLLPSEALDGDGLRLEWCGGVFHPRDQAVEQGEWIFHH